MSIADEDAFQMQYLLAKSAFQNNQSYLHFKFAQDAIAKDTGRSPEESAILRILIGLFQISSNNFSTAVNVFTEEALKIPEATVEQQESFRSRLSEVTTVTDLSYYISLLALQSCSRETLKNFVLKSNNFISLSLATPESFSVIENFLNGNYIEFQAQLHQIKSALRYDIYFGEHCNPKIFNLIRLKAL